MTLIVNWTPGTGVNDILTKFNIFLLDKMPFVKNVVCKISATFTDFNELKDNTQGANTHVFRLQFSP